MTGRHKVVQLHRREQRFLHFVHSTYRSRLSKFMNTISLTNRPQQPFTVSNFNTLLEFFDSTFCRHRLILRPVDHESLEFRVLFFKLLQPAQPRRATARRISSVSCKTSCRCFPSCGIPPHDGRAQLGLLQSVCDLLFGKLARPHGMTCWSSLQHHARISRFQTEWFAGLGPHTPSPPSKYHKFNI